MREVSSYFRNYASVRDWSFVPGLVEGRPAAIVHDPAEPARAASYFILLEWTSDRVARIRDFRYARYAAADAEIFVPA